MWFQGLAKKGELQVGSQRVQPCAGLVLVDRYKERVES